jgi:hypothetical protein
VEPDEIWAYRARAADALTPVRVLKHGTKTPARVLVRFEDPGMEGREEWVPPARLKVRWTEAEDFQANENRWDRVCALSPRGDTYETDAASQVFELVVAREIAELDYRSHYLSVWDLPALVGRSGVPAGSFTEDPVGFELDGGRVVSWPVALEAARALAARHPDTILDEVAREERKYQYEAIHGCHYPGRGRGRAWIVSPESIRELDAEHYRPVRELLRSWCGQAPVARFEELEELRKEIKRVGDVAEEAIGMLRAKGFIREAARLSIQLGETVEMLRVEPRDAPGR